MYNIKTKESKVVIFLIESTLGSQRNLASFLGQALNDAQQESWARNT